MTKEISKQICEKCGIEYSIQRYTDRGQPFEDVKLELDLGKPENFVKLLELPIKDNIKVDTIVDYLGYICTRFWDRKSCLKEILHRIETDYIFGEQIKQAIREAGWNYD